MNNWFSKKFQSQVKTQDLTKVALSKLQHWENQKNASKQQEKSQETSSRCPNCSLKLGLNNTISVPLRTDLLNNTELHNVTSVEEICLDPGFQTFLSAQLNLYYQFIMNASNNTILSSAMKRSSFMNTGEMSHIPVPEPGTSGFTRCQIETDYSTSQGELNRPLETQPALSLIEEEEPNEQVEAVDCSQASKGRSDNVAKGIQSVSSQPSRFTQRLKDKLIQKSLEIPKPSLPPSSYQVDTVKKCSDKSPTRSHTSEKTVNTSVVKNTTKSTAETSVQRSRAGTKRIAAVDTTEVIAPHSDDDVFKKPLPLKRRANPSRSNTKLKTTTVDLDSEDESAMSEFEQTHENSLHQQLPVSHRIEPEPSDIYRSRRGRVSKPPGNFWNPSCDKKYVQSQSKVPGHPRKEAQTKVKVNPPLMAVDKQLPRSSVSDINSESGYSSVVSGRKTTQTSKVTRTEVPTVAEKSATLEQAPKRPRGKNAKPTTLNSVDAAKESDSADQVSADDAKKPRRGRPKKTVSEDTFIENKEKGTFDSVDEANDSADQVSADNAKKLRRGRQQKRTVNEDTLIENKENSVLGKTAAVNPRRVTAAASKLVRDAPTRNIFSDGYNSSDDESEENHNRRQEIVAPKVAGHSKQVHNNKLLIIEDSFEEEEPVKVRQRSRNDREMSRRVTREERVIVEISSDEEERMPKKQPAVKRFRQTVPTRKKGLHVPEETLMVNHKVRSRPKRRYLFAGSSSEEESLCSYRTSDVNAKRSYGSESCEDDERYVRGARSRRR